MKKDHWIAGDELCTQTIKTTISDHFTVAASILFTSRKAYKKTGKEKGQKIEELERR